MNDVTEILSAIERGEPLAADRLLPLVYDELRRLAARKMAHEKPGQTIDATGLVHEAYLRLTSEPGRAAEAATWDNRGHFFAAAAEAMRRILIERARERATVKRGGQRQRVPLESVDLAASTPPEELLAIDEALGELETHDAQAAQLVKLRFFAGFGHQEAAEALGISRRAADRLWSIARAWLFARISEE